MDTLTLMQNLPCLSSNNSIDLTDLCVVCVVGGFCSEFIITAEVDSINPPLRLVDVRSCGVVLVDRSNAIDLSAIDRIHYYCLAFIDRYPELDICTN